MNKTINCQVECLNGCILGEECPNKEFVAKTSQFLENTSLDKMLEMAEMARLKKMSEPPKWIIPDDF
ncbi:hypothetical protein [Geminocystis herdmanii]|uniref:hypothetical protein n=1 Tax=Geminocystis herdmanii TaxID=669359 RepID=UPI0003478DD3|nr:hypothetical protein [Geminocystis herdmanii]